MSAGSAARVALVLVAAGTGTRLGAAEPKALVDLAGEPVLAHALARVLASSTVEHVVVVGPPGSLDRVADACAEAVDDERVDIDVVAGGSDRPDSVRCGLATLHERDEIVLVHDAARALAPPSLVDAVANAVRAGHPAVVPGLPVHDTIKEVDGTGRIVGTVDRAPLRRAQTPQGFAREVLERAHAERSSDATDDAALVEALGVPVLVIEGDERAAKITTPADLAAAAALLLR